MAHAIAFAVDCYVLTFASGFTSLDISTHFILHKRPSSNHPHFWLMPVATMMIKEPLFSVFSNFCLLTPFFTPLGTSKNAKYSILKELNIIPYRTFPVK